ncbi:4668_t:CDS:2 [Cetraspora pellucida]|uniref:4668_t:CDS:1 n=1 Tax=Cetraspora pellucida TaxID=1433469 RepID=A0ACA9KZJ1_9GLOM|nr:4668_t:CDS:2 [Cetraspora pellucida]
MNNFNLNKRSGILIQTTEYQYAYTISNQTQDTKDIRTKPTYQEVEQALINVVKADIYYKKPKEAKDYFIKEAQIDKEAEDFLNLVNNNSSVPIILSNTIPSKNLTIYKKALDHLDFIVQRLGYPDDASRNSDVLDNFIKKELYKRLGYVNYNIQSKKLYATKKPMTKKLNKKLIARYCSMCGKAGYTKMNCSKFKKAKKINNISSSQYIDQSQSEDDINNKSTQEESSQEESDQEIKPLFLTCSEKDILLSLTSSNYSEKAGGSLSSAKQDTLCLNYAIIQYQEAQLYQNWFDLLKINFLQIKEPNNYATISCIENDTLTISNEFSVLPTEKDNNGNNISLFILGTRWQHRAG